MLSPYAGYAIAIVSTHPSLPPYLRARKCGEINSASITRETCADNGDPVSPVANSVR